MGQFANFIKVQSAALRMHEQPLTCSARAGESAFQMSEQFTLDHVRGDCTAVDRHEKLVGPVGERMERRVFSARS
jgi:hypothetical protein